MKKITKCSFQKDWVVAHPQIHYDEMRDSALCHIYVRAYHQNCISDNNIEPRWISEVHTNWKDTTCEGRGFKCHKLSKGHKEVSSTLSFFQRAQKIQVKHRRAKEGEINSNFDQLCYLQAEDNPFLFDWVKRKGDKYTSEDIQNEMMRVMALQVLREIAAKIRSADFFNIMVDETTNVTNISQLVLCIRWVNDNLD